MRFQLLRHLRSGTLFLALASAGVAGAEAQQSECLATSPNQTDPNAADSATARPCVKWVQVVRSGESEDAIVKAPVEARKEIALGEGLLVRVERLGKITEKVRPDNPLGVFLDGILMRGVDVTKEPGRDDIVRVRLERNEVDGNKKAWVKLLGHPRTWKWSIPLAIGTQDGANTAMGANVMVRLFASSASWAVMGLVIVLFALGLFVAVATPVLRDGGNPRADERPAAFSLAKTQMAVWSMVILIGFLVIWAVSGSMDSITPSLLALMGIGSGTALGSAVVDARKRTVAAREYAQLEKEEKSLLAANVARRLDLLELQKTVQAGLAANQPDVAAQTRLEHLTAEIKNAKERLTSIADEKIVRSPDAEAVASEGFLKDLMTDDDGYSLHRVQMVGWTVVLLVLFCVGVYRDLSLPDLDSTLLALMGISAGTYLGFKLPEKQTPQPEPVGTGAPSAAAGTNKGSAVTTT